MNIQGVGALSLGQWAAIGRQWDRAHGGAQLSAPTGDEFEEAVMRARGVV